MSQSFPEHLKGNEAFFAALTEQTSKLLRSSFEVRLSSFSLFFFSCLNLGYRYSVQHAWTELSFAGTYSEFVKRSNELEEVERSARRRREEEGVEPACSWLCVQFLFFSACLFLLGDTELGLMTYKVK
jgi:hypothetical protein